jgi:hypothetical protein
MIWLERKVKVSAPSPPLPIISIPTSIFTFISTYKTRSLPLSTRPGHNEGDILRVHGRSLNGDFAVVVGGLVGYAIWLCVWY